MWLAILTAGAQEVSVGPDGYASISDALGDAAATVIVVAPGTWSFSPDLDGRTVEIRGSGVGSTILDVRDTFHVRGASIIKLTDLSLVESDNHITPLLRVHGGASVELASVAFRGDSGFSQVDAWQRPAMIDVYTGGTLTGDGVDILGGESGVGPGSLWVEGTVDLAHTQIAGMYGRPERPEGSMVEVAAGASLTLRSSVLGGMRGDARYALIARSATVVLEDVDVVDNIANQAAPMRAESSTTTITDSRFVDNRGNGAGAIEIVGGTLTLEGSLFRGNRGAFGAVRCESATCDLDRVVFEANQADDRAAAVLFVGAEGSLTGSSLCANRAPRDGAALRLESSLVTVQRDLFFDNRGGAVGVAGGALLDQSVFAANDDANGLVVHGDEFIVRDSIVIDHDLPEGSTDPLFRAGAVTDATVLNTALDGNIASADGVVRTAGIDLAELHVRPFRACRLEDARLLPDSSLIGASSTLDDIGAFPRGEDGDADEDGTIARYDCDDTDEAVVEPVLVFPGDRDLDGHADPDAAGTQFTACPGPGRALVDDDCDDENSDVRPSAVEDLGGLDLDCDGFVDPAVEPGRACASNGGASLLGLALLPLLTRRRRSA
ncbi:MAG: hypothetical protein H6736_04275 [Alphaproteobacteria bacterium]|nr:hypothetical protein [Alphaproteobacteria bacterium]